MEQCKGCGVILPLKNMDLLVVSADNKVVCTTETTYQAQFIVQTCNAHEELLKSLKNIVARVEEKGTNLIPSHTCLEIKYVAKAAIVKAEAKGGDA